MNSVYYAVARWSSRAREHVRRRGFTADEAADAVQESLLDLGEKLLDPAFEPPREPRAYLYAHAVGKAHELRRHGRREVLAEGDRDLIAEKTVEVLAAKDLADPDAGAPDRELNAQVEARAFVEWHGRVVGFVRLIESHDREVLASKEAASPEDPPATPQARQAFHRVRKRTQKLARRFGIYSPWRPDDHPFSGARSRR